MYAHRVHATQPASSRLLRRHSVHTRAPARVPHASAAALSAAQGRQSTVRHSISALLPRRPSLWFLSKKLQRNNLTFALSWCASGQIRIPDLNRSCLMSLLLVSLICLFGYMSDVIHGVNQGLIKFRYRRSAINRNNYDRRHSELACFVAQSYRYATSSTAMRSVP